MTYSMEYTPVWLLGALPRLSYEIRASSQQGELVGLTPCYQAGVCSPTNHHSLIMKALLELGWRSVQEHEKEIFNGLHRVILGWFLVTVHQDLLFTWTRHQLALAVHTFTITVGITCAKLSIKLTCGLETFGVCANSPH